MDKGSLVNKYGMIVVKDIGREVDQETTWDEFMQGDFRALNIQCDVAQDTKMEVCYQVHLCS